MSFSASTQPAHRRAVQLDLRGELRGIAAEQLRSAIVELVAVGQPDALLVNLAGLASLDLAGAGALVSGYAIAIDYGTSYRVINVPDQAHRVLRDAGLLDILTGTDDIGTLLLAILAGPAPRSDRQRHDA